MHSAEPSLEAQRPPPPITGRTLILEIEDLYTRLAGETLQRNPFWRAMVEAPEAVPERIFHGLCIENYQLLVRESYFDSPALSFPWSRAVRLMFNEFYCEELGHDRLLLRALESIGLDEEMLFDSLPLPGTMGLCNALSYWARHDPLFFLTTLGPLEGREVEIDSFIAAARRKGLPAAFVEPIAAHAGINKDSRHGTLTRKLFGEIPVVGGAEAERIRRRTSLFVAIYDRFYTDIWEHYGSDRPLLRRVSEL